MRAPPQVRAIADKPGIYRFDMVSYYFFFEVVENGRIHQLDPETLEQAGLLRADRWTEASLRGDVTFIKERT